MMSHSSESSTVSLSRALRLPAITRSFLSSALPALPPFFDFFACFATGPAYSRQRHAVENGRLQRLEIVLVQWRRILEGRHRRSFVTVIRRIHTLAAIRRQQ